MSIFKCFFLLLILYCQSPGQESHLSLLRAENTDGRKVSFSEYYKRGPLVISFWAMWCVPCRSELKALQLLCDELKDRNITVAAVNIDNTKSLAKVKSYITAQKFSFPCFLDPNQELFKTLNGQELPCLFIIDTDGSIVSKRIGYEPGDEIALKRILTDMLKN